MMPMSIGDTPYIIATSLAIHSSDWSTMSLGFIGCVLLPAGKTITFQWNA